MSTTFLGTLLLIIQTVLYIPAVQHFRQSNKQTAGFNIVSELVWAVTGIGWIWYAILINNIILIMSGSIVLVGSTIITCYLWSHMLTVSSFMVFYTIASFHPAVWLGWLARLWGRLVLYRSIISRETYYQGWVMWKTNTGKGFLL